MSAAAAPMLAGGGTAPAKVTAASAGHASIDQASRPGRTPRRSSTAAQALEAAGRQAEHVAYWDVAAALCTVGDMAYCLPGDLVGELGRPDLNAAILTARRDAFLAAALDQLDS